MKKNIKDLAMRAGMTGMAALSMAGALAGTAFAATPTKGTDTTEAVTYYDNLGTTEAGAFDGTGRDQLFDVTDGAFAGKVNKATKVVVEQGASIAVEVPFKITLAGAKGATDGNKADYSIRVKGDIAGDTQVNVVPNTATTVKNENKVGVAAAQEDNFAKDTGSGTFLMAESAGVKKAITATITQAKDDTRWTMAKDGTDTGATAYLDKTKTGKVTVANLSAGKWENDISFDISATEIDADYAN